MNKLIYVLTAGLLASQVHAQLLHLGTAANVDAGATLGAAVHGTTNAVGTAAGALQNTTGEIGAGVRASVAAPAVEADGQTGAQARSNISGGAHAGKQVLPPAQAGTTGDARLGAHMDVPVRAVTRNVRIQQPAAAGAGAGARVQSNANALVVTPRVQAGTGLDAHLSGSVQGR